MLDYLKYWLHIKKVDKHYQKLNKNYQQYLGGVIQGARPANEDELLKYLNERICFKKGEKVLDAGCGFGFPAAYFLKNNELLHIACITLNQFQADKSKETLDKVDKKSDQSFRVVKGDFHRLNDYFEDKFDVIYFFESFCHHYDIDKMLNSIHSVLNSDGRVFIKDYFVREDHKLTQSKVQIGLKRLNEVYGFNFTKDYTVRNTTEIFSKTFNKIEISDLNFKVDLNAVSKFHDSINIFGGPDLGITIEELFDLIEVKEIYCHLNADKS